jgi:hypothetical protein
MAKKQQASGGLYAYGQMQKKGKDQKLFPTLEDINPQLKEKGGSRRRG